MDLSSLLEQTVPYWTLRVQVLICHGKDAVSAIGGIRTVWYEGIGFVCAMSWPPHEPGLGYRVVNSTRDVVCALHMQALAASCCKHEHPYGQTKVGIPIGYMQHYVFSIKSRHEPALHRAGRNSTANPSNQVSPAFSTLAVMIFFLSLLVGLTVALPTQRVIGPDKRAEPSKDPIEVCEFYMSHTQPLELVLR